MSRRIRVILPVLALLLGLLPLAAPSAVAQERPDYVVADPSFDALDGATAFSGTLDGAGGEHGYQIEVPDDWNGTLVLYAHGFVGTTEADLVVQPPPLRELFIAQGVAWAASSYSANGYVIDTSVDETQQLRDEFAALTGMDEPAQTIIHGFSMGGHVTGVAVERYPEAYVGALPACGVMGDQVLFDYFADVNLVAGALAGVDVPVPGDVSFLAGPAQTIDVALGLSGDLTPAGVQYADVVESLSGGERPTFEQSLEFWNQAAAIPLPEGPPVPFLQALYGRALSGGIEDPVGAVGPYDNSETQYQFPNDDAEASREEQALNDAVTRIAGDGASPFPTIAGTPGIPVLSLHTSGDLFVPMVNQQVYAQEVLDNDLADNLVQRTIRAAGHCDFTGVELATAFTDLLTWVGTGEAPAGDDLLDPAVVADRDFGCLWTSEDRPTMPPCEGAGSAVTTTVIDDDPVAMAIGVAQLREAASTVVLARADDFADALAGAPLAGLRDAPILLTPSDQLDPTVLAEIQRLGATNVELLGGRAALSAQVESALVDAGIQVSRRAGSNRYQTATVIREAVIEGGATPTGVFVASAGSFADAVGVSALAAHRRWPILLTDVDRLPDITASALADTDGEVVLLGGTDVISEAVAGQIGDSRRLAGETRYGTSAAIVAESVGAGLRINAPVVTEGESFPAGLVGGPAAADAGQVLILVDADDLVSSPETTAAIADLAPAVGALTLVGPGTFTDESAASLTTAAREGGSTGAP